MIPRLRVGVVVALALLTSGCSDHPHRHHAHQATPLLQGIPQQGTILGRPDAPVRMDIFADLQCAYCRKFDQHALPGLIERYVRPGRLQLRLHLLSDIGPDSQLAARLALAAGLQHRLWQLVLRFYAHQGTENTGWVQRRLPEVIAEVPGLSRARLLADSGQARWAGVLRAQTWLANRLHVRGTPSFQIYRAGRPHGRVATASRLELLTFVPVIEQLLSDSSAG